MYYCFFTYSVIVKCIFFHLLVLFLQQISNIVELLFIPLNNDVIIQLFQFYIQYYGLKTNYKQNRILYQTSRFVNFVHVIM